MIFVDEPDDRINPLGIKGVGEIGIVGVAAAIANAVYHATGKTRTGSANHARQAPAVIKGLRAFTAFGESAAPPARSPRFAPVTTKEGA